MLEKIEWQEIKDILDKRKKKKAPGPSKIQYEWLKVLKEAGQKSFTRILNQILTEGEIPKSWKKGTLYPIPKKKDWDDNPLNLRPIALLETPRKIFTKIITNRLAKIIQEYNLLQENNWAGLPGGSTKNPINLLNECREDAIHKNKDLWVCFQDIQKAYDSVPILLLIKALKRIHVPEKIQAILQSLFQNRENQVITAHGLTEEYILEDGLDQGDTICPLLWRIFYDPLLTKINNSLLVYTLKETEIVDFKHNTLHTNKINIPALVFMDDTTWLAETSENLQQILNIASSFYQMSDIHVNGEKTKILKLSKPRLKNKEDINPTTFDLDKQKIPTITNNEGIRILGVWYEKKNNKQTQKKKMESIARNIARFLKTKNISTEIAKELINTVAIPKLDYLATDLILPPTS
jgi:hypothetical protein